MNKSNTFRVYLLYDNRHPMFTPDYRCYIGYTRYSVDKRLNSHFKEAKHSDKRNKRLNWLRTLCKDNIGVEILQDFIFTEEEALQLEVYYIQKFKEDGLEYALRNGDCGGIGGTKNYTEEIIEKIRISKIGNSWNLGKHHSEETRRKISEGNKNRIVKPESIEKTKETKRKNKEAGKRFIRTKRKLSEQDVVEIFRKYNDDFLSAKQIAVFYGCNMSTIRAVLSCKKAYAYEKKKNGLFIKPNRPSGYGHPAAAELLNNIKKEATVRRAEKRKKFLEDIEFRTFRKNEQRLDLLVQILRMGREGMLQKDISKKLKMHKKSVSRLVAGRSWAAGLIETAKLKIKNESE